MREELAFDQEAYRTRVRSRELQLSEPVCRVVWRERATGDADERELVVEDCVLAALDRGAAWAEVGPVDPAEREVELAVANREEPAELAEARAARCGDWKVGQRPALQPDLGRLLTI